MVAGGGGGGGAGWAPAIAGAAASAKVTRAGREEASLSIGPTIKQVPFQAAFLAVEGREPGVLEGRVAHVGTRAAVHPNGDVCAVGRRTHAASSVARALQGSLSAPRDKSAPVTHPTPPTVCPRDLSTSDGQAHRTAPGSRGEALVPAESPARSTARPRSEVTLRPEQNSGYPGSVTRRFSLGAAWGARCRMRHARRRARITRLRRTRTVGPRS